MPRKKSDTIPADLKTADYRYTNEKRTNIPPAKIASEGNVPQVPKARYYYSPHLPPVLRFDPTGEADAIAQLAETAMTRPLSAAEAAKLRAALRVSEPTLEWATKREQHEKGFFEVDPVALHIHERVSARAIISAAMREDVQREMFADPQQPYQQAVQFYKHDVDWANRLILGDSLQVMSSLARRENLAGKVQMIYMDPPYGIKFASNFQSEIGKRNVKEKDEDLTREPEMVKAYRDTWTLGVHSYLGYLRDRLLVCHELLADTGSIFVQISDENIHRVRSLLDEIFGPTNFRALITFRTTVPLTSAGLGGVVDYLLWYAKDHSRAKYRDLFVPRETGEKSRYSNIELLNGSRRSLSVDEKANIGASAEIGRPYADMDLASTGFTPSCTFDFQYNGRRYRTSSGKSWKTTKQGMERLASAGRITDSGSTIRYVIFHDDYPVTKLSNAWMDTTGELDKSYVVQTHTKVIERCLLMTTEPGDLVLDPTCGSGTTAFVAEQYGRRWITADTSRVAINVARQRLVSAMFSLYEVRGESSRDATGFGSINPVGGFNHKTVPHVTIKSIAQNPALDAVLAKHGSTLAAFLARLNNALADVTPGLREHFRRKLAEKERSQGRRSVTDADRRRWLLPEKEWSEWEVPFDVDEDWPEPLKEALRLYRDAWRTRRDDINACIAVNADQEELVDQPRVVKGVVRVSGPFTVEGVRPEDLSLGEEGLFDGTPNQFEVEGDDSLEIVAQQNLQVYLSRMVQYIRRDGLTFLGNKHRKFARVEPLFENGTGAVLHAEGEWEDLAGNGGPNVAIGFGPQYGPVTAQQVEELIRASRRYDELVIAGFSFDAEATAVVQESSHPKLRIHQAYIRPDVNPAMEGLLKETPNSQLFTVFGTPEIEVKKSDDGEWTVTLAGVDVYDPVANTVRSTGADKVAAWFLDSDFDGRCFCITQAFFPDQDAWEKIAKALGSSADAEAFEAFKGTESLPFSTGKHKRIAVKVIDPRGNEVMAVRALEA